MTAPDGPRAQLVTAQRAGFSLPLRVYGSGTPVLFLHGLGSDSRDSLRDLGALPGLLLALADQRGHGGARPTVGPGQFGLDDLADDMAAMIESLGWHRPVIGGGSMGAAVALRYALRDPAGCSALVLVAPALGPERAAAAGPLAGVADRIEALGLPAAVSELRGLAEAARAADGPRPAPPRPEDQAGPLAPWLRQDAASLAAAMRAVADWRPFTSFAELSALPIPVVIVGIDGDPLHPAGLAVQFHDSMPGSSLEILPSAGEASRPGAIGAAVLRGMRALGIGHQAAVNS